MFKPAHIYAFSLGAGLTLILMLFIGYGLDGDMGFCKLDAAGSTAETPVTCAREWLSTIATIVAAISATYIGIAANRFLRSQSTWTKYQAISPKIERQIAELKLEKEAISYALFKCRHRPFTKPDDVGDPTETLEHEAILVWSAIEDCFQSLPIERKEHFRILNYKSCFTGQDSIPETLEVSEAKEWLLKECRKSFRQRLTKISEEHAAKLTELKKWQDRHVSDGTVEE